MYRLLQTLRKSMGAVRLLSRSNIPLVTALAIVIAAAGVTATPVQAASVTQTYTPVADTMVQKSYPNKNFGGSSTMTIDNSPIDQALMKFTIANTAGYTVQSAKLRLYNVNTSVAGGSFYRTADTGWGEKTVTWNTAPAADPTPFASLGAVKTGTWYTVDASSIVKGDGTYSFKITTPSSDSAGYRTKEASSNKPQLVLTLAPVQTTPDTTPPSTPQNLVATPMSDTAVSLSWSAATDDTAVAGYRIYRDGADLGVTPSGTNYTDSGLTAATAYSYTVAAFDAAGNMSPQSAAAQVTTNDAGTGSTSAQISTLWVIMMENTSWSTVKNSATSTMPYLHGTLLPNYAHAEQYFSQNHPSLPNYITLESGGNQGLTSGSYLPTDHTTNAQHLTTLLANKGLDWKYWAENLPGNGTTCNLTDPGFPYSEDHNPFVYFQDVQSNTSYCIAHERPFSEFAGSLSSPPAYNFVVPNDPDQGEKCAGGGTSCTQAQKLTQADNFLKSTIPQIQTSPAYAHGAILVLWDEAASSADPNTTPSGLIVVSPFARQNYASNVTYNHGSTLRTEEGLFGVSPLLGNAATAADLSDMFSVPLQ